MSHPRPDVLQLALDYTPTAERYRSHKPALIHRKGDRCKACGYAFDGRNKHHFAFHHRDRMTKAFSLGNCRKPLEALEMEADKCDLLCLFCHVDIHHDEDRSGWEKRPSVDRTNWRLSEVISSSLSV